MEFSARKTTINRYLPELNCSRVETARLGVEPSLLTSFLLLSRCRILSFLWTLDCVYDAGCSDTEASGADGFSCIWLSNFSRNRSRRASPSASALAVHSPHRTSSGDAEIKAIISLSLFPTISKTTPSATKDSNRTVTPPHLLQWMFSCCVGRRELKDMIRAVARG